VTWVKIGDTALDEPFLLDLPRGTVLLHIEALAYSNRYAVDGVIHRAALRKLTTEPDPEAAAAALVSAGLWAPTKEGWQLIWLLNDQPSSQEIQASREQARHRQERKRRHSKGDHSICDPKRCHVLVTRDNPRDGATPPTRPSPTLPDRERGGRKDGDAAGLLEPAAAVQEETIVCHDFTGHQNYHRLSGKGWDCGLCSRRDLAKIVREAPSESMRFRYRKIFDKAYGELYGRVPA
jgi:hypothetical protein